MKLKCYHGFYIFEETKVGQISDFMSLTQLDLSPRDNYFTFDFCSATPTYSLLGKAFNGFTSIKTFEGKPWEVFEQNGVVYDINSETLKVISSITQVINIYQSGNRYTSSGLIQAGSINQNGDRVKSFSAFFSRDTLKWLYSEVTYV